MLSVCNAHVLCAYTYIASRRAGTLNRHFPHWLGTVRACSNPHVDFTLRLKSGRTKKVGKRGLDKYMLAW